MDDLLFLAHRIPYPPDKGDKIRSWHLLRHLARHWRVHLGCLVDDPQDWRHLPVLADLCASVHAAPLHPRLARLRGVAAPLTGQPLSFAYFHHRGLAAWVRHRHAQRPIAAQFIFSSAMAGYAEAITGFDGVRIVDLCDLDSAKWRAYAATARPPRRWIWDYEAQALARAERAIARRADACLFVSEAEADLFRRQDGVDGARVHAVGNGIDLDTFTPAHHHPNPYPPDGPVLVFTGVMDYHPNIDAVTWFTREALPIIQVRCPTARFAIVGARPTAAVRRLGALRGVIVTGRVPDIRPWLAHAALAVAPLRIARGVQNKVLEAMAMARPVVASPQAVAGIDATPGRDLLVADGAAAVAGAVLDLLGDPAAAANLGARARARVEADYRWDARLQALDRLFATLGQPPRRHPHPSRPDAPCAA